MVDTGPFTIGSFDWLYYRCYYWGVYLQKVLSEPNGYKGRYDTNKNWNN